MTGNHTLHLPPREAPITPAPALMPQHHPMLTIANTTDTEPEELAVAIHSESETDAAPAIRAHLRGNKITLTVPDEILAVADLTGRTPADIFADLLAAQVSAIRTKAKGLLSEVAI